MRKKLAIVLAVLLVLIPATAFAGDITEKEDYSDSQTSPSKISQSAPFTLTGTLSNGSISGDIDCVQFTTKEKARYEFVLSSDTQKFIPTIGLIQLTDNNDFLTLTKHTPNTPADAGSVFYDFDKGETVTIVMTTASTDTNGANPYTLTVTMTDIPSNITAFSLPGIDLKDVVIDADTSTVTAVAPAGAELKNIAPVIEGALGEDAVFIPAITEPQDFSKPVVYKLSSELGSVEEWTIIVRTQGAQENISDLKSVFVDGDPLADFSPDVTEYDMTVPNEKKDIGFVVKPLSELSQLSERSVSKSLEIGANTVQITVTAQNGEEKVYTFNILRESGDFEEVGAAEDAENAAPEPLPSYVIIGIVVAVLAAAGIALYLMRNRLFFHR